jgi:hypothetical protein
MEYLLDTLTLKFTKLSVMSDHTLRGLVPEEIPEIQPLHIHKVVIDKNKVTNRDNKRDNYRDNRIIQRTHFFLLLCHQVQPLIKPYRPLWQLSQAFNSTGALDTGKPVEKP